MVFLSCNLPRPVGDRPSLLPFKDVGSSRPFTAMHSLLAEAFTDYFHGVLGFNAACCLRLLVCVLLSFSEVVFVNGR